MGSILVIGNAISQIVARKLFVYEINKRDSRLEIDFFFAFSLLTLNIYISNSFVAIKVNVWVGAFRFGTMRKTIFKYG